jgi:hypothetical protein
VVVGWPRTDAAIRFNRSRYCGADNPPTTLFVTTSPAGVIITSVGSFSTPNSRAVLGKYWALIWTGT